MTGSRPSVLISILSWDSPAYLANLLANLDACQPSPQGRTSVHIHVLDQGGCPETRDPILRFAAAGSNRSIGFLKKNVGFPVGHNHVFDKIYGRRRFDYFLPLNQDVVFEEAGWLDGMVAAMADETVAVAGPSPWRLSARPGILLEPYPPPVDDPDRIYTLQASVSIIRTSAIERFGLFDTMFTPAYFEDTDLCRRYVAAGCRLAWIDVRHRHAYMGISEKLVQRKAEDLKARFGEFYKRNHRAFRRRWMNGPEPVVTAESLPSLFPTVYRPPVREMAAEPLDA